MSGPAVIDADEAASNRARLVVGDHLRDAIEQAAATLGDRELSVIALAIKLMAEHCAALSPGPAGALLFAIAGETCAGIDDPEARLNARGDAQRAFKHLAEVDARSGGAPFIVRRAQP